MFTKDTTKYELELRMQASKLSIRELNQLIDECLDQENFEDAKIFAEIYNRRVSNVCTIPKPYDKRT